MGGKLARCKKRAGLIGPDANKKNRDGQASVGGRPGGGGGGGGDIICGRGTISASGLCLWGTISASKLCPGGHNLLPCPAISDIHTCLCIENACKVFDFFQTLTQ